MSGALFDLSSFKAQNAKPDGRPLILSASRRTDLPGFHAAALAERIRTRQARLRSRFLYGVVFWTRHAAPFLAGGPLHRLVADELQNPVVNLTVTGLGETALEPGVPSTREIIDALPALVDAFHGQAWRIRWRFDPLLAEHSSLEAFLRIGEAMAKVSVKTCTFSFPSYFSLKGDLTRQFEAAGIRPWRPEEKPLFLSEMARIAKGLNIKLLSSNQPENLACEAAIGEAACVSRDILERGHPSGLALGLAKDRSQRAHCNCIESEDIGNTLTDLCAGGCAYCYSKAGGRLTTATAKGSADR